MEEETLETSETSDRERLRTRLELYLDAFLARPYDVSKLDTATLNSLFDEFNMRFYTLSSEDRQTSRRKMLRHIARCVDASVSLEQIRKGELLYDLYDKGMRLGLDGHTTRKIYELALGYFTGFSDDYALSEYLVSKRVLGHMLDICGGKLTEGYCCSHSSEIKQMLIKLLEVAERPEYHEEAEGLYSKIKEQVIEAIGEEDAAYILPVYE